METIIIMMEGYESMGIILPKVKEMGLKIHESMFYLAFYKTLFQWFMLIVLFFFASVVAQAVANISFSELFLKLIGIIQKDINYLTGEMVQIQVLRNTFFATLLFVFCFQILRRRSEFLKWTNYNNFLHDKTMSKDEKLEKYKLQLLILTNYKEVNSAKKDLIISCSPMPIMVAILGYVMEKFGPNKLDLSNYVLICIALVALYLFFCIKTIKERKNLNWEIYRLKEIEFKIRKMG